MATIVVTDPAYGAVGNGIADDTAAFVAAIAAAEAAATRPALGSANGSVDVAGTIKIRIPAGRYRITAKDTLIRSSFNNKRIGLVFEGDGTTLTEILYQPTTLDGATPNTPLAVNDAWLVVRFRGIKFSCHSSAAGASFMHSNAIQNQQNYLFDDCEWSGSWGHGFYLTGTNNNSEFRFNSCATNNFRIRPFLESVGSDQFLNYWFDKFQHWSAWQPIVRMTLGGHVSFRDVDVSDWGNGIGTGSAPNECYIAELLGISHNLGVCHFRVDGLRVEAKSVNAKLLFSEWPQGVIQMSGVDYSSQFGAITRAVTFTADAGTDNVTHAGVDWPTGTRVRVSNNGGALPAGFSDATNYWTIRQSAGVSRLALNPANAFAGVAINITTNGTGTQTVTASEYNGLIYLRYQNVIGANVSLRDSEMAGNIVLEHAVSMWDQEPSVLVDNCQWLGMERPSDIVIYRATGGNPGGRPNVRFRGCNARFPYTSQHKPVWDYDSAVRSAMGANVAEKLYVVHGGGGNFTPGSVTRVLMPFGSIITRFRALYKTGVGDADAATYRLRTSDGSPVTIATVSWANRNTGAGYAETGTLLPFFCDTTAQCNLDVVTDPDVGAADSELTLVIYYI
jgi:hypothetical protein